MLEPTSCCPPPYESQMEANGGDPTNPNQLEAQCMHFLKSIIAYIYNIYLKKNQETLNKNWKF